MNVLMDPALTRFALHWNLRFNTMSAPDPGTKDFCMVGTSVGEYPIDAWKPYLIEVPRTGSKKDIVGRGHHIFGISMKSPAWDHKRVVHLPVYLNGKDADIKMFGNVVRHWKELRIPDHIPCISIAAKCQGLYSDHIAAQSVTVLLVWSDMVGQILSLDWSEGPWEDCQTPEWHSYASPIMGLEKVLEKTRRVFEHISWNATSFSTYVLPFCLGRGLRGERALTQYRNFGHELNYDDYSTFKEDLGSLLSGISDIFSPLPGPSEADVGISDPYQVDPLGVHGEHTRTGPIDPEE